MYKMLLFYITFFLITIHGEVINASNTCNNKNNYQLPAEIEQLIEHYQDDAAIEAIIKNTAQYEHQDFLHTILHPREAAFEKTDALHKKIIYFFPEYIKTYQGKSIGISVGDIINVGTHTLQYYLDKREVINVLDKLTHNFTLIIEENLDIIISSLEENNLEAITTLLIQNIWSRERINYSVLQSYLKYRLIYAAIECIKKNNTPPPFFMHGKTTEGRLIDRENLSIATVTSFIPPAILEKFFDGDTKTTLSDTWWSNDTTKNSLMFCAIGSQYALEGAKQAEL
ncbi:hypothetical protein FJ364_06125, partial [Candidatus Dependentiae bacterium]|nr:hypothetical protein [Candidatus Dependentiae bacterium]